MATFSESGQFWECSALERSLRSGRLAKRPKAGRSHGYCVHFRRYPEGRAVFAAALSETGELVSRSSLAKRAALSLEPTGTQARPAFGVCERRTVVFQPFAVASRAAARFGLRDSRSLESGLVRFAQAE